MKKYFNLKALFVLGIFAAIAAITYLTPPEYSTGANIAALSMLGLTGAIKAQKSPSYLDTIGDDEDFDSWEDGLDDLDLTSFDETLDNLDSVARDLKRRGDYTKASRLRKFGRQARALKGLVAANAMNPIGNGGIGKKMIASLTIKITRPTANINADLPVILFGKTQASSFYKGIITSPLLPAGINYTGLQKGTFADPNSFVFEYTDPNGGSPLIDTIVVTLGNGNVTYPEFFDYLNTNIFEVGKIRHTLNNTSALALTTQNNEINQFVNTMWGASKSDNVTPIDYKDPYQQQNGILDIPFSFKIDQERGLATKLAPVAGLVLTLSMPITNTIQQKA